MMYRSCCLRRQCANRNDVDSFFCLTRELSIAGDDGHEGGRLVSGVFVRSELLSKSLQARNALVNLILGNLELESRPRTVREFNDRIYFETAVIAIVLDGMRGGELQRRCVND